jgi:hypothetical protein
VIEASSSRRAVPWLAALLVAACSHADRPVTLSQPTVSAPPAEAGVAASPSPTPAPSSAPAPSEEPAPSPSPDCIHTSDHEVATVSLAVYFLECGGERIPGSRDTMKVPVGCRVHLNATPRDGMGVPTCSRSWPVWQLGPPELVTGGGGDTFTLAFTAQAEGRLWVRCIVDGVRSDYLFLDFIER